MCEPLHGWEPLNNFGIPAESSANRVILRSQNPGRTRTQPGHFLPGRPVVAPQGKPVAPVSPSNGPQNRVSGVGLAGEYLQKRIVSEVRTSVGRKHVLKNQSISGVARPGDGGMECQRSAPCRDFAGCFACLPGWSHHARCDRAPTRFLGRELLEGYHDPLASTYQARLWCVGRSGALVPKGPPT